MLATELVVVEDTYERSWAYAPGPADLMPCPEGASLERGDLRQHSQSSLS